MGKKRKISSKYALLALVLIGLVVVFFYQFPESDQSLNYEAGIVKADGTVI